jgi:hypothetical protein
MMLAFWTASSPDYSTGVITLYRCPTFSNLSNIDHFAGITVRNYSCEFRVGLYCIHSAEAPG